MNHPPEKPDKTDWHRLWGLMISPVFERLGCETIVEMDLSAKTQRLDMVVVTRAERPRYEELPPDYYEGFENLNEHNLISFKSFREVFNMTALEELYGHLTNYRKEKKIGEKDRGRVNLYAVTHHFPRDLFAPFQKPPFLRCVTERRIYELNLLTPVRFVITRESSHPVIGLFSDNPEQIMASRMRLEKDGWLTGQVSSYLKKLYDYYFKEGIDMAYTQEMFIKEHYPEWHDKIRAAEAFGIEKGIEKGALIGKIIMARQILHESPCSRKMLEDKNTEELQRIFAGFEKKLRLTH